MDQSFLFEIELWSRLNCQPYERSWMTAVLAILRYAPQGITLLLYFAGIRYRELYLLLFGIGLTLSSLLNWLLNEIERAPRIATCPPLHGALIAWPVQQAAFFVVFSLGYAALYHARLKLWHIALLLLFYISTVFGAHMLNYHFGDAIISGAALGALLALSYQSLLYYFIVPWFCTLLDTRLARYFHYQDTLCTDEPSELLSRAAPKAED